MGQIQSQPSEPIPIELARHETVIEKGKKTFIEVGLALMAIRDGRLYRERYGTFENYCRVRWGWSRRRCNQMIGAAGAIGQSLGTTVPKNTPSSHRRKTTKIVPTSERQARPLTKLPEDRRAAAWNEAVASAPRTDAGKPRITAEHVEAVVGRQMELLKPVEERLTTPIKRKDIEQRVRDAEGDAKQIRESATRPWHIICTVTFNRDNIPQAADTIRQKVGDNIACAIAAEIFNLLGQELPPA